MTLNPKRRAQDCFEWERVLIRSCEGKTPKIHPTAFISKAAYVLGNVVVGEYSSVWPGAVLRGDCGSIIIGRNTNIQDNCVLHADDYLAFGDAVVVTHGAVLYCHKVGNNVMVGVNAVLLENVEVGDNFIIGAGSVVLTDVIVPQDSMVIGVPGKVRPLREELRQRIWLGAALYRKNAQRFREEGLGDESLKGVLINATRKIVRMAYSPNFFAALENPSIAPSNT